MTDPTKPVYDGKEINRCKEWIKENEALISAIKQLADKETAAPDRDKYHCVHKQNHIDKTENIE